MQKKWTKAGQSRERGINGYARETFVGLCRESPLLLWLRRLSWLSQMIGLKIK
jgi:hypothetical protein